MMILDQVLLPLVLLFSWSLRTSAFTVVQTPAERMSTELNSSLSPAVLYQPKERDVQYGKNIANSAQYLLDLDSSKATFDFCGGMMFQLVLSKKLREHLESEASGDQPVVFDSSKRRMLDIEGYSQTSKADNCRVFHGRELRSIPHAKGGFGFVLQLSYADEDEECSDPEGWSVEECKTYDGWKHDAGRTWRKANDYESEGFVDFAERFGNKAFGLNHRFYLHFDENQRMWLSAEDGCEGTPKDAENPIKRMFGF